MNEIKEKTTRMLYFVNSLRYLKKNILTDVNDFYLMYPIKIQTIELTSQTNKSNKDKYLIQYSKLNDDSKILIMYQDVILLSDEIKELNKKEDEKSIKKMMMLIMHGYMVMKELLSCLEDQQIYLLNLSLENLVIDSNGQIKLMLKPNIIIIKDDDVSLWSILPYLEEKDELPLELELLRHNNMSLLDIEEIINKEMMKRNKSSLSSGSNLEMNNVISEERLKLFMSMENKDINDKEYVKEIKEKTKEKWKMYGLNRLFYEWLFEDEEMERMMKEKMKKINMDERMMMNFKETLKNDMW